MTHRLSIRLANLEDQQELGALWKRASWVNKGDREALLAQPVDYHVNGEDIADGRVFVAERQGKILGFATVQCRENGDGEMSALFVDPDVWRGGIGKLLVTRCCSYLKEQGGNSLSVIGNPHAEGFYDACGFESLGTVETELGTGLRLRVKIQDLL